MKTKIKFLLIMLVIYAPVIGMLIPPTILFILSGENNFLATGVTIIIYLLSILLGYTILKDFKKLEKSASKDSEALKI